MGMFRSSDLPALLRNSRATGRPSVPPVQQEPRPARGMNGWERKYADRLAALQAAGDVLWFGYECVKLRLANRTWYTPDFLVVLRSGALECHEVKGHWRDDARVKIKVAAEMFPAFAFYAVTRPGGVWSFERIPGGGVLHREA